MSIGADDCKSHAIDSNDFADSRGSAEKLFLQARPQEGDSPPLGNVIREIHRPRKGTSLRISPYSGNKRHDRGVRKPLLMPRCPKFNVP